ncbi:MAG TPA: hypothetical protein VK756_00640 [Solirubrobacteraceae bacterium]|jgi:hypothetical protein|nr:hypothetical protein [Solirubrobacteraceae bacterium]
MLTDDRPVFVGMSGLALLLALVCVFAGAAPTTALAVPEGRVYEMVSPLFKGGYGVGGIGPEAGVPAVAPDGESVEFQSFGAFSGALFSGLTGYIARRGPAGWSTTSLAPPASLLPAQLGGGRPQGLSPNLELSLNEGVPGPDQGRAEGTRKEAEYMVHATAGAADPASFQVAGKVLNAVGEGSFIPELVGASEDFSHIVFFTDDNKEALLPEAVGAELDTREEYDLSTTGAEAGVLRLVGVKNNGQLINPSCDVTGTASTGPGAQTLPLPDDGEEVFFTTTPAGGECGLHQQLFVRLGGARTVEVSRPLSPCSEVPCGPEAATRPPAQFVAASEDGSTVLFTTAAPLTSSDEDGARDLYLAKIGCPAGDPACGVAEREVTSLVQVSHDPHSGEAAEVQGVVATAADGSRVYFVARGVLSGAPNAEGRAAVRGADNLYVYDSSGGAPVFVTDLCSGPELSGLAKEVRCPSTLEFGENASGNDTGLWSGQNLQAETAGGDARFLLFSSFGRLLPGDSDTARDIYRYDALSGTLDRVSIGEGGADADGNDSEFGVELGYLRAISEDGSRVVFATSEQLSPLARAGVINNYEWHEEPGWSEGVVSLVGPGDNGEGGGRALTISVSGRDIFFLTSEGLVSQDSDGAPDLYDARLGGGFPLAAASREPCAGDACQGALTNPAPLLVPGSVSQTPEAAPAPPAATETARAKTKPKTVKRRGKRKATRRHGRRKTSGHGKGRK